MSKLWHIGGDIVELDEIISVDTFESYLPDFDLEFYGIFIKIRGKNNRADVFKEKSSRDYVLGQILKDLGWKEK